MGGGGTERLTVDLMTGMLARGVQVDLVLLQVRGELLPLVPEGIRIVDLGAPRLRSAVAPLRHYMKRERPDAVLAAMWPLTIVAIVAGTGVRPRPHIIVSEHCPLLEQYAGNMVTIAALTATIRIAYRKANAIVAVSHGLAREIAMLAAIPVERVTVINNPVPVPLRSDADPESLWPPRPTVRFLAVGALKGAKNYGLLLEAFARLTRQCNAALAIVGEGDQRETIQIRGAALGLSDRLYLPGFTPTPGDWYAGADVYVLSSDYEGFGNVMVEALHHGVTVVATDCPTGPAEVLGNGRWGYLVQPRNPAAYAEAMLKAVGAPKDPEALKVRAQMFSPERACEAYADLLLA